MHLYGITIFASSQKACQFFCWLVSLKRFFTHKIYSVRETRVVHYTVINLRITLLETGHKMNGRGLRCYTRPVLTMSEYAIMIASSLNILARRGGTFPTTADHGGEGWEYRPEFLSCDWHVVNNFCSLNDES